MNDERRELLRRVLASSRFAHADSLRRILQYLCERTEDPQAPSAKEHEIAMQALNRPATFEPKADPIIRVSIATIRDRLRSYYENEGRQDPLRITIPKGQYRVVFAEPGPEEQKLEWPGDSLSARRKFWQPYLLGNAPNILVYTELLFFRDDSGTYLRNIYVNELGTAAAELGQRLPGLPIAEMKPSFHFVSAGEMHSLLDITKSFHEMGVPIEVRNSRFFSWADLQRSNLILLGSSRTNSFLNSLQGQETFLISSDCIRNLKPAAGEEATYQGHRFVDGKLERLVEYAVVTRRPGVVGDSATTLIAANHGRAIEGAGFFLTHEDKVRQMLHSMGLTQASALPNHFQVLLRVEMIDFDEEVVNVEYVTHRVG